MHGHITSLLGQRLGSLRLTDGDRWRPDFRMLGRSDHDVTEIISTDPVPLSNRYSQLPKEDALFPVETVEIKSPLPKSLPLSAEVLGQNDEASIPGLQEDAYKSRVDDWVDGVDTIRSASRGKADENLKLTRTMSFAHRLRSRASSLSLRGAGHDFRKYTPQRGRKDASTSRSTSAADSARGASGASSTDSPRQDSIKSAASTYSLMSSKTSLESSGNTTPSKSPPVGDDKIDKTDKHEKAGRYGSAIFDPSAAGVFEAQPPPDLGKPLPSPPARTPRRAASHRHFSSLPENNLQSPGLQAPKRPSSAQSWRRAKKKAGTSSSYSREMLDILDDEFMQSIAGVSQGVSVQDRVSQGLLLEEEDTLCEIKPLQIKQRFRTPVYTAPDQGGVLLSPTVVTDPEVSPTQPLIPRRSSRRIVLPDEDEGMLPFPDETDESPILPKGQQPEIKVEKATRKSLNIKSLELKKHDSLDMKDSLLSPPLPFPSPNPRSARVSILVPAAPEDLKRESELDFDSWRPQSPTKIQTAREAAETALLRIMGALSSLDDVTNVSSINKGMRRVYKENEISVLSTVLKNQSPAAWELREWTTPPNPDSSSDSELKTATYTANSYRRMALNDRNVIRRLKPMLVARCSSFLRPDMASALTADEDDRASRFEEALYRIWCFCVIFGSGKQREQDLVGQLDWLKGGELANQSGFTATIAMNLEYDMTSVLVSPPEHFGHCNRGRLSADELYDLTEAWNCLTALLQDYVGKTEQARAHGVFQHCDIEAGNIEAEVSALEEWIFYILSLGPSAVLKLAEHSDDTDAGFEAASRMGWMEWAPSPSGSSRGSFLREPVCRLYEESVMMLEKSKSTNSEEQQRRQESRARVATMAEEIRAARCASNFKRIPFTDMSDERPMSMFTTRTRPDSIMSSANIGLPATGINDSASLAASARASAIWMISHPKHSGVWPGWKADSVEEDGSRSGSTSRQSHGRNSPDPELDCALHNVVAMGFATADARKALEKTRRDGGVSVERAVNWLLAPEPTTFLNLDD